MEMPDTSLSKPVSATSLFLNTLPSSGATLSGKFMTGWPEYMVDALQRSVLFLELLRQRGNEEVEITSRPMATVLRFGHEVMAHRGQHGESGSCRGGLLTGTADVHQRSGDLVDRCAMSS